MEAKSEAKDAAEEKSNGGDYLFFHNPCNYFQEFIRLLLNCLGLSTSSDAAQPQQPDPPSSSADDPPAAELSVNPPRAPPRPPISGGGPPQNNANPN